MMMNSGVCYSDKDVSTLLFWIIRSVCAINQTPCLQMKKCSLSTRIGLVRASLGSYNGASLQCLGSAITDSAAERRSQYIELAEFYIKFKVPVNGKDIVRHYSAFSLFLDQTKLRLWIRSDIIRRWWRHHKMEVDMVLLSLMNLFSFMIRVTESSSTGLRDPSSGSWPMEETLTLPTSMIWRHDPYVMLALKNLALSCGKCVNPERPRYGHALSLLILCSSTSYPTPRL